MNEKIYSIFKLNKKKTSGKTSERFIVSKSICLRSMHKILSWINKNVERQIMRWKEEKNNFSLEI